jgi:VanZ family protein
MRAEVRHDAVQRSSSGPLALAFAALILYASLYPFSGWRWPPGVPFGALLELPWPPWRDTFDVLSNIVGYMPLGTLLMVFQLRGGRSLLRAGLIALVAAAALSYATEVAQQFVPARVPSRVDWALNCGGAALGIAAVAALHSLGLLRRWQAVRERWFVRDSAGALALLTLWPLALLSPAPVPLGLGHLGGRAREWLGEGLAGLLDGTPWAPWWESLASAPGEGAPQLSAGAEALVQLLGLLAPCLLAFSVTRGFARRCAVAVGLLLLAVVVTTLATALGFGPAHALAWATASSLPALLAGLLLAVLAARLGPRAVAAAGVAALVVMVWQVSQAPGDPYFAISLQNWEQGRFVRFHGLALWIAWLWPYAACLWMLRQLFLRHPR